MSNNQHLFGIIYSVHFEGEVKYIGQTIQTEKRKNSKYAERYNTPENLLLERKRVHKNGQCRYLRNAIDKYGFDSFDFKVEIIFYGLSENDIRIKADELEIEYIKKFNTFAPNGYNLTTGGQKQQQLSEDTCKLLSEIGKARRGKYTAAARANMSKALMNHPVSSETRNKISESQKKSFTDQRKKQISERNSKLNNHQKNEIFEKYETQNISVSSLADEYNVTITTITNLLKKHNKQVKWGKGGHYSKGSEHPNSKHSEETVISIYKMKNTGKSGREVAKVFDVTPQYVSNIWNKKKWKHILEKL